MSSENDPPPENAPGRRSSDNPAAPWSQEIRHSQVTALVPEEVGRGVFSTGAVVIEGTEEFIIDFLLRMSSPHHVAARVVLPISVVPRLIAALGENLRNYEKRFGPPPPLPVSTSPPPGTQVSIQEVYDQLKLPERVMSGAYANAVMIGHTPTEFSFDFITNFFPRSAVSCRVFLAAPNVPKFLDSLKHSFEQYQRKLAARRAQAQPPSPPASPSGESPGVTPEESPESPDDPG